MWIAVCELCCYVQCCVSVGAIKAAPTHCGSVRCATPGCASILFRLPLALRDVAALGRGPLRLTCSDWQQRRVCIQSHMPSIGLRGLIPCITDIACTTMCCASDHDTVSCDSSTSLVAYPIVRPAVDIRQSGISSNIYSVSCSGTSAPF